MYRLSVIFWIMPTGPPPRPPPPWRPSPCPRPCPGVAAPGCCCALTAPAAAASAPARTTLPSTKTRFMLRLHEVPVAGCQSPGVRTSVPSRTNHPATQPPATRPLRFLSRDRIRPAIVPVGNVWATPFQIRLGRSGEAAAATLSARGRPCAATPTEDETVRNRSTASHSEQFPPELPAASPSACLRSCHLARHHMCRIGGMGDVDRKKHD